MDSIFLGSMIIADGVPRRLFLVWSCLAASLPLNVRANEPPARDQVLAEWATVIPHTGASHVRLRIHSSGLVESWAVASSPCLREQRRPEQVYLFVDTLMSAVRDHDLSTDSIAREIREESRRLGLTSEIRSADDTSLTLSTKSGQLEVRCPALPLLAERFPDAPRVQAFARLERRLENLQCIVQCGGEEASRKLCALATERLQAEHPGAPAWSVDDLTMVRVSRDGGRFAQFRREDAGPECWTTCVMDIPGRAPRVTVLPPASRTR